MIGYKEVRDMGGCWRHHQGVLVPQTMPHVLPLLTVNDARKLVVRERTLLIRWEEEFDRIADSAWWHIIKDDFEDLENLSGNSRSKVRRALKRFVCCPVSRKDIQDEGYDVYRAAFERYETFEPLLPEDRFRALVGELPQEVEFWAVRDRETGTMISFSENIVRDGACFYNTIWFEPEALKRYAGYALFHEMNKHYLNECGLAYVSDGARNISHQTGIHEFLEQKFLFRRAYAKLRVVYFPGVGLIVRLLYPFRNWFGRRSAGILRKVAVVLEQERIRRSCLKWDSKG